MQIKYSETMPKSDVRKLHTNITVCLKSRLTLQRTFTYNRVLLG